MTSTAPSTRRLERSTPSETAIRWPTTELLLSSARRDHAMKLLSLYQRAGPPGAGLTYKKSPAASIVGLSRVQEPGGRTSKSAGHRLKPRGRGRVPGAFLDLEH